MPEVRKKYTSAVRNKIASAQSWKCDECMETLDYAFEIDHKDPLHKDGTNNIENLHALCRNCHGRKTIDEAIQRHTRLTLSKTTLPTETKFRLSKDIKLLAKDTKLELPKATLVFPKATLILPNATLILPKETIIKQSMTKRKQSHTTPIKDSKTTRKKCKVIVTSKYFTDEGRKESRALFENFHRKRGSFVRAKSV
jgi:hypothetical protein